jgi:hypothetical protein
MRLVLEFTYICQCEETYALRKTIRPMRPKPLIPTCDGVLVAGAWPSGVEEAHLDNHDELFDCCAVKVRELKMMSCD